MRHLFYSGLAVPSICFIILTIQPQSLSFIHYVPMSTCEWPFNLTRMSMDCGRNRHDDTQTPQAVYLFIWLFVCLFVYSLRAQLYCGTLASVNNQIENDTFLNCLLILFPYHSYYILKSCLEQYVWKQDSFCLCTQRNLNQNPIFCRHKA